MTQISLRDAFGLAMVDRRVGLARYQGLSGDLQPASPDGDSERLAPLARQARGRAGDSRAWASSTVRPGGGGEAEIRCNQNVLRITTIREGERQEAPALAIGGTAESEFVDGEIRAASGSVERLP